MITGNIIFIACYGIIGYTISYKSAAGHSLSQQRKHHKSLILCVGIVITFMVSTTPFIALYLLTWKRPSWLVAVGQNTFAFNSSVNSILFLVQYYNIWRDERRKKRSATTGSEDSGHANISLGDFKSQDEQSTTCNAVTKDASTFLSHQAAVLQIDEMSRV